MSAEVARIIALGASNLTLGLHALVSTVRASWGPQVDVLAALGLGRSYGVPSRVLVRTLPGILQAGLWREVESLPDASTRGLVTDIGNDILYGFSAEQILTWVEEAVLRLRGLTSDVLITDLPVEAIRKLSPARFLLFRTIFFPSSRLSYGQVLEGVERVSAGLPRLAETHDVRLIRQRADWYGFDPVHIRPGQRLTAWREILDAPRSLEIETISTTEGLRLSLLRPERQRLFGVEQVTTRNSLTLRSGARVWLY